MRAWAGLLAVITLVTACGTSSTQPVPSPSPKAVRGPLGGVGGLAFDESAGQMVFVDPSGAGTWTWDGIHDWQQQHPSFAPTTQRGKVGGPPVAMAWDANSKSLIAVVGDMPPSIGAPQVPPATWSWHAGSWTRLDGAGTPDVVGGSMAAFPPKHQLLLFSGCCTAAGNFLAAKPGMWAWDGRAWSELHPAHMPPARWGAAMAYYADSNRIVLYGGIPKEPDTLPLNDAWVWDGSDWGPVAGPPLSSDLVVTPLAYGPLTALVLTATGQPPTFRSETWTWDGVAWQRRAVTTPACYFCELAYDPVNRWTVMVTNLQGSPDLQADIFVWNGDAWKARSGVVLPG